jgi:phthalate 4,5-dioxygenase oxygenase subunit
MHRGASLALGRCEGDGIRCLYHGWKFATTGEILETPNHKTDSITSRLRAPVYPVHESGGLIWVYLGPAEFKPELPEFPFTTLPETNRDAVRITVNANFVQIMEGTIDSSHNGLLHEDYDFLGKRTRAEHIRYLRSDAQLFSDDDAPRIEVDEHPFGLLIAGVRDALLGADPVRYARVHAWIQPFSTMVPPDFHIFNVPIDDENTSFYAVRYQQHEPVEPYSFRSLYGQPGDYADYEAGVRHYGGSAANGWYQDRGRMRNDESFTGIIGVAAEDFAVCQSMTPVYDRSNEHLAPSDIGVIHMRRALIDSAERLQAGESLDVVGGTELAKIRSVDGVLGASGDWRELLDGPRPAAELRGSERPA